MVRAILAGTKSQTRRALRPGTWLDPTHGVIRMAPAGLACTGFAQVPCPYGQPGDRLWVREAWRAVAPCDDQPPRDITPNRNWLRYEADPEIDNGINWGKLRPGMFMPRWASRITLRITDVRVERLQDISDKDAEAEGIERTRGGDLWRTYRPDCVQHWGTDAELGHTSARASFSWLWESINGPGSWDTNAWVWVLSFEREEPTR